MPFFPLMKLPTTFELSPRRHARWLSYLICLAALMVFSACSEDKQTPADVLITVNDFTISRAQFNNLLKFESEVNPAFQLSKEERGEFLRRLIEKQVLVQEARSRKLDEQELFRQTIERYWESTLIRDLLRSQSEALHQGAAVTEEETAAWYQAHKDKLPQQSFAEQRVNIRQAVEDEKVETAMRQWVNELRAKARVSVADSELRAEANIDDNQPINTATPEEVK